MFRILSSKRYWSLIGKIADDQETIKGQADVINCQKEMLEEKQKTIDHLNDIISKRDRMILSLERHLKASDLQLDFPSTSKLDYKDMSGESINVILGH